MSRGVVFTVADLSLDREALQQKILREHIFYIVIYLCNGINITHTINYSATNFANTPFTKLPELSWPYFLASSTASLMATPAGTVSSFKIS